MERRPLLSEIDLEYFILGLISGVLLFLGYIAYLRYKLKKVLIQSAIRTLEQLREFVIPCTIEVDDNKLFIYNRKNGQFLADGSTMEELEGKLKSLYPQKYFDVAQLEIDKAMEVSVTNKMKGKVNGVGNG